MRTVLLERRLPPHLKAGEALLPEAAVCCTPGLIRWRDSYVTADLKRAYLLVETPDLESMRMFVRRCGTDVRLKYEVYDHLLRPTACPNMLFEVFTSERRDLHAIIRMVQSATADSTAVRVMADVRGQSALVLARTECHTLKPLPGVTVKSYQPLVAEATPWIKMPVGAS